MLQSPRLGWISRTFTVIVMGTHFIRILFRMLRLIYPAGISSIKNKPTYTWPVLMCYYLASNVHFWFLLPTCLIARCHCISSLNGRKASDYCMMGGRQNGRHRSEIFTCKPPPPRHDQTATLLSKECRLHIISGCLNCF